MGDVGITIGLVLGVLASAVGLVYPLRLKWPHALGAVALLFTLILLAYAGWGGFPAWRESVAEEARVKTVHTLLTTHAGREKLIQRLRARLQKTPNHARGWELLGQLYLSVGDTQGARDALRTATSLRAVHAE